MPFKLVAKDREAELREKKDNFRIKLPIRPETVVEYYPDNWTEGVAVVIIDTDTEEVVAYWGSFGGAGAWSFIDEQQAIYPYLFKRPKAAFSRMQKAGEVVNLRPYGKPRREARLALWWAGDEPELSKYRQIGGSRFPGSPRR